MVTRIRDSSDSKFCLCLRAQWEIRELFARVKAEVEKVAPRIGAELMIKCDRLGYCDEKETCGLYPLKGERAPAEAARQS